MSKTTAVGYANSLLREIEKLEKENYKLVEALKEAQHYILAQKKSIRNIDVFHIQNVMAQAISNATEEGK